jgi:hypothetical protein
MDRRETRTVLIGKADSDEAEADEYMRRVWHWQRDHQEDSEEAPPACQDEPDFSYWGPY